MAESIPGRAGPFCLPQREVRLADGRAYSNGPTPSATGPGVGRCLSNCTSYFQSQSPMYTQLHSWDNLLLAYRKAAKGKRGQPNVAAFEHRLEKESPFSALSPTRNDGDSNGVRASITNANSVSC